MSAADRRRQAHPYVAVDVAAFTVDGGHLKTLLVKVGRGPLAGLWSFPGGIVRLDESPDAAVTRELRENTGLKRSYKEQIYTFGGPDRDPRARIVSIAYLALHSGKRRETPATTKYAAVEYFPVRHLPPLAYDHDRLARMALDRLRAKLAYTNIVYSLLPPVFTMAELQSAYQIILGRRIDRRNFRRKLIALKLLARVAGTRRGCHRPAALYTFRHRRPRLIQIL